MSKNLKLLHGGHCNSANTVRGQSVVPMKVSPEPYNFYPILFSCLSDGYVPISIFLPVGLAAKVARKREYVGPISIIHSIR